MRSKFNPDHDQYYPGLKPKYDRAKISARFTTNLNPNTNPKLDRTFVKIQTPGPRFQIPGQCKQRRDRISPKFWTHVTQILNSCHPNPNRLLASGLTQEPQAGAKHQLRNQRKSCEKSKTWASPTSSKFSEKVRKKIARLCRAKSVCEENCSLILMKNWGRDATIDRKSVV